MPAFRKTEMAIVPGQPWRATEHNALVNLSAALVAVVTHEHGDAGDHNSVEFAVAGGVAEWNGAAWSLLRSQGIASISGTASRATIVLARQMRSSADWGVIGQTFQGDHIDTVQAGKTRDTVTIRTAFKEFFFLVVGPHAPL